MYLFTFLFEPYTITIIAEDEISAYNHLLDVYNVPKSYTYRVNKEIIEDNLPIVTSVFERKRNYK